MGFVRNDDRCVLWWASGGDIDMNPDSKTLEIWNKFDNDIAKRRYGMRLLLAIDQFFNVLLLNGSQDQTLSGHIAKKQYESTDRWYHNLLCDILKRIESSHCWLSRKE